jgi:glutaredoxin
VTLGAAVSRRSLLGLVLLVLMVSAASQWWMYRAEANIGRRIAALAKPGDLQMISSDTCAICKVARRWFSEHRVAFSECSIERDAACRAQFDALRSPATPVILVRGQPELGFDPQRLERRLAGA